MAHGNHPTTRSRPIPIKKTPTNLTKSQPREVCQETTLSLETNYDLATWNMYHRIVEYRMRNNTPWNDKDHHSCTEKQSTPTYKHKCGSSTDEQSQHNETPDCPCGVLQAGTLPLFTSSPSDIEDVPSLVSTTACFAEDDIFEMDL